MSNVKHDMSFCMTIHVPVRCGMDQCQRSCPASASSPKRGDGQGVPRKGNQSPIVPIFLRQKSRHVSFVWSWGNMTWYINISWYIIYCILYWLKLVRCVSKPNILKRHHWWRPKRGISAVVEELFHIEADKESHVSAVKGKVAAVAGVSGKLRVILFGKEPPMIWSEDRGAKEQPTKTGSILYYTLLYFPILYFTILWLVWPAMCAEVTLDILQYDWVWSRLNHQAFIASSHRRSWMMSNLAVELV